MGFSKNLILTFLAVILLNLAICQDVPTIKLRKVVELDLDFIVTDVTAPDSQISEKIENDQNLKNERKRHFSYF
jgi:hypothetical protein